MLTGYASLWAACASSGVLVPVPEDLPLLFAGILVADGEWQWVPALVVAFAGVLCRDLVAWTVGRALGSLVLDGGRARRWLHRPTLDRAQRLVHRHGAAAVLVGRFFVGFRVPFFAVAGAMGIPLASFALWDAVGLCVAVPLAVALGYAFGHPLHGAVVAVTEVARAWALPVGVTVAALSIWRLGVIRRAIPEEAR